MPIREVCVRYRKSDVALKKGEVFTNSQQVFRGFADLALEPVEVFHVLFLDTKNRMLCFEAVARGSLSTCVVHPREVFSHAVRLHCAAIIAVHNHPSGVPDPSPEDIEITNRLQQAAKILGIRFLDHIIICEELYFSFADQGLLQFGGRWS